jgi:antitoxin YefM
MSVNSTRLLTAIKRAKAEIIQPQNIDEFYDKFGLNEDDNTEIYFY